MAAGDIMDAKRAQVIEVAAGGAVAVGDLVHIEADGYWDKTASGDVGKFGVALDEAAAEGDKIRVGVEGEFEVTASAAAIAKGDYVIADAGVVKAAGTLDATSVVGLIVGYTRTAFVSGGTGTITLLG